MTAIEVGRTLPTAAQRAKIDAQMDTTDVVLVLQGGGAKAAYQVGVFHALADAGLEPKWVLGISSGGLNAAVVAGSEPSDRVAKLDALWARIGDRWDWSAGMPEPLRRMARAGQALSGLSARRNFFRPWPLPPFLYPPGSAGAVSQFDQGPLEDTLNDLVDWKRIGHDPMLTLGAVDLQYGKPRFFNSFPRSVLTPSGEIVTNRPAASIDARHVLATAALPPGAAPISIDGADYWDAGLQVSTPLDEVVAELVGGGFKSNDVLVVIVDLWGQTGTRPSNLLETNQRKAEIEYRGLIDASVRRFGASVLIHQLGKRVKAAEQRAAAAEARVKELEAQLAAPPTPPAAPGRPGILDPLHLAASAVLGPQQAADQPQLDLTSFWGQVDLTRLSMLHVEVGRAPYLPGMSALDFSPSAVAERRGHGYDDMRAVLEDAQWTADLLAGRGGMLHRYTAGGFANKSEWYSSLNLEWTLGTV